LGRFSPYDHQRFRSRLNFSSNETSSSNSENYSSGDLFRYKTPIIFVCIPRDGYDRLFRMYIPIIDILLVAVIPFLLLCLTNIGIIVFTMRNNRRMNQHHKRSHRRHYRLTIMLLSVTLAFIGLTCPSVIFICVNKIIYSGRILTERKDTGNERANQGQPAHVQLLVDVCEALWYTKHAMNFILYTLSGQDFRREFLKLFTQCCNRRSFLIRKLISKHDSTSSTVDSTIDTQIRIINPNRKIFHRKKLPISNSVPLNSLSNIDEYS
jgi:hypothetical protein